MIQFLVFECWPTARMSIKLTIYKAINFCPICFAFGLNG